MSYSTSPSVYLSVVGTAAVRDECGDFGPTLTNPIITLPPNVLSTYVPPTYSIGSTYTDPNVNYNSEGFVGDAKPLTIADLQCPTFGLGIETRADGDVHTTVGPPWLPIIIPPPEVLTLDPTWESMCTDLASIYVFYSFAIFDPPVALTPESYLVPPSPAAPSPKLKDPPNVPANPTSAYDPPATHLPDLSDLSRSSADSVAPPVGNSPTPQETPANVAQPAAVPLDPAVKPTIAPDPPSKSPSQPQNGDSAPSKSPGIGSFVADALGKSDPQASGSGSADPTHIIPVPVSGVDEVTVGNQILSINPSGVYLSGTSFSPGGPAITLSGGVFSLVSTSPVLDNSPIQDATAPDEKSPVNNEPFTPVVQTIAGHSVVSNSSGVYVAGSSLSPGGSAITASGTVISLSPAGTFAVGSSSIAIPLAETQGTSPTNLNFAGVTVQAEPSATIVNGIPLTPGGPGTEINGKAISLEQGGTLVVGTDRLVLPTAQPPTPSAFNLNGMMVQQDSSAVLVDGTALTPGGPGISINGQLISLEPDRTLDIGTSHFVLPPAAQQTAPNELSIDGIAVQILPSAVLIHGTTLTPGGPAISIDGKRVSLEQNGKILDIGTSHFALPGAPQQTPPPSPIGFNVDGMTVQAIQSAVVVDGVTLTPGGPGKTINGSRVSLEVNGTLDIGTGRFAVPTGVANRTSALQMFEGGQDRASRVSRLLGFGAVVVWGLWVLVLVVR